MPTSPYSAIPTIMHLLEALQPGSVLDIGIGFGKYGLLLRESAFMSQSAMHNLRLDGIEAYAPYVGEVQRGLYDTLYVEEALAVLPRLPDHRYDVVLAMEIVEHFERDRAIEFIRECRRLSTTAFILSTPRGFAPQDAYAGNEFERHRSYVSSTELRSLGARFLADRWSTLAVFLAPERRLHWSITPCASEFESQLRLSAYGVREWVRQHWHL